MKEDKDRNLISEIRTDNKKKKLEESFFQHKISSVDGLKRKIPVAVATRIKKTNSLCRTEEDYEKTVPKEIREKLTVCMIRI